MNIFLFFFIVQLVALYGLILGSEYLKDSTFGAPQLKKIPVDPRKDLERNRSGY